MINWKDFSINPQTSIIKTIELINSTAQQIAVVADEKGKLLGIVSDGDIRRGILKGISLDKPVHLIMSPQPVAARLNDGRENILSLMKLKSIRHIPVVDEQGFIVGLEILNELIQQRERENRVVLMAGGLGSRLQPLTNDCPKPLLQVGSKPILETILENFIEYGFRHFYLSVNYKAEMVEAYFKDGSQWGVEIHYLHEQKPMGTAGPLGLLPEKPGQPILVMNGDLLTKVNFQQMLDFHLEHQAQATMCVREYEFQIPYGVVKMDQHRLVNIEEKPVHRFFVNAGIYVLDPKVLDLIPKNIYFDMPELFKTIVSRNLETAAFPIREYWLDIGRMEDLERAKGEYPGIFE